MDYLYELVREYIEYKKLNFDDCKNQSEEEIFENVIENVVSMVSEYTYDEHLSAKNKNKTH